MNPHEANLLVAQQIRVSHMNRAHGFVYLRDRPASAGFLSQVHDENDPTRGMNVIICGWLRDGLPIALTHHSYN